MSARSSRQKSPSCGLWLLVAVALVAILIGVLLGTWVWRQAGEIQGLRGEVQALQVDQQLAETQAARAQATAIALETRLRALEASDPARQIAALRAQVDAGAGSQEVHDLSEVLAAVQATVDDLQAGVDDLAGRIRSLESQDAMPLQVRLDVPRQRQSHNLSCESSAASMAAYYHGVPLTEAQVLATLPRHLNPHLGFRGNVDGPTGGLQDYGVYAAPIVDILNSHGLQTAIVEDGLAGIKAALIRGNPVIAWLTYNCQPGTPTTTTIEGEAVILVPYQHVVVISGYNAEGMWANDPWDGQEDFYFTADLERAMGYFGHMAVEVAAP